MNHPFLTHISYNTAKENWISSVYSWIPRIETEGPSLADTVTTHFYPLDLVF